MIHEDNKIINRDDKYTGKKQETEEKLRVLFSQREKTNYEEDPHSPR